MGSILTGLATPIKIGTITDDFKKSLNTLPSQGIKLTKNALSNTISNRAADSRIYNVTPTSGVGLSEEDAKSAKIWNALVPVNDGGGIEIKNTYGEGIWAPVGTSYNEAASFLGAPSHVGAGLAAGKALFSMFDVVVTGGNGGKIVRFGKGISMTANQVKAATLVPRIFSTAAYYNYKGQDILSSFLIATGQNVNILTLYRLKGILPGKVGSVISHTSHDLFTAVKDLNILGATTQRSIFTLRNYIDKSSSLTRYKARGSKLQTIKFTLNPDKVIGNVGIYEGLKEIASPYSFFAGKFGMSNDVYLEKAKTFENNFDVINAAAMSAYDGQSSKDYRKQYGGTFMKLLKNAEEYEQASDSYSPEKNFRKRQDEVHKKGYNVYGYVSKTLESGAAEIDDQIRVNRYTIINANSMTENFWKMGEYGQFFKVLPGVLALNTGLSTVNAVLNVGNFAINTGIAIKEPVDDLLNYAYINAQIIDNNITQSAKALKTWWKTGKLPAKKEVKKEEKPLAAVSHTLFVPAYINKNPGSDMISNDLKYIRRNIPKDALLTEAEVTANKATGALVDQQKALLNQLKEWEENFKPSFFTRTTKAGRPANAKDFKQRKQIQQQYIDITSYINNIRNAALKGNLKYDYGTKGFLFTPQIGKN
jgi:hypothetical protein